MAPEYFNQSGATPEKKGVNGGKYDPLWDAYNRGQSTVPFAGENPDPSAIEQKLRNEAQQDTPTPNLTTYGQDQQPLDEPYGGLIKLHEIASPFTIELATSMAQTGNKEFVEKDLYNAAREGTPPVTHIENINQATVDAQLQKAIADRTANVPLEADPKAMDTATQKYQESLGQSPKAPELVQPKVDDNTAIIGLIGTLLGGIGVAPDIIKGIQAGAQHQADLKNQENQYKFQNDTNAHNKQLEGMRFGVQNETTKYNREQERNYKEYVQRDRTFASQIDDFDKQIAHRDKLIQEGKEAIQKDWDTSIKNLREDAKRQFEDLEGWTADDQKEFEQRALSIAARHTHDPASMVAKAKQIIQEFGIYRVGQKSFKVDNANAKLDQGQIKIAQTQAKTFIDQHMKSVKGFTQEAHDQLTKWVQDNGLSGDIVIPGVMESEQAYNNRMNRIERARHNKASESIGQTNANTGLGRLNETKRSNLIKENQGQQKINQGSRKNADGTPLSDKQLQANIKAFGAEFVASQGGRVEQFGPGSIKASLHPSGRALDFYPTDFDKGLKHLMQRGVPYLIYNKKQYKLQPDGSYLRSDYHGLSPHTDHIHGDWKGGEPTETEASAMTDNVDKVFNDSNKPPTKPTKPAQKTNPNQHPGGAGPQMPTKPTGKLDNGVTYKKKK